MKEINRAGAQLFGMSGRKLTGAVERSIHIQRQLFQRATSQVLLDAGQCRDLLALDLCAATGWLYASFMKGAMANRIFELQGMQRQIKQPGTPQAAIFSDRLGSARFFGE
jgi:hypothetical protein